VRLRARASPLAPGFAACVVEEVIMTPAARATPSVYLGLFLVTLATLVFEILLTRIFSITLWYHFAFMAISVALFGITVGALVVHVRPSWFPPEKLQQRLAESALCFGLLIVVSVLAHLVCPFDHPELQWLILGINFLVVALPFVCSGVCVCLVLSRYPIQVNSLYAADLAGAGLGCLMIFLLLRVMDGVSAAFATALLACLGAVVFAGRGGVRLRAAAACVVLAALTGTQAVAAHQQRPLFRLTTAKGRLLSPPVHERWNSFSRLTVTVGPEGPSAWSLSPTYRGDSKVRHYWLLIDSCAGTPFVEFDGDLAKVDYLKYDVANFVHYVRPKGSLLIVGTGGGRDVLTGLLFGKERIVGVDVNEDILDLANNQFGDFTGHLDRHPRVRLVNDEARSYLAGLQDQFDVLQITFVDTWAATAAGAFTLTENALYTRGAWGVFLDRLTPRGVLAVSRGFHEKERMYELYRLTALARAALLDRGAARPEDHMVMVRNVVPQSESSWGGMALLLVGRTPFSPEDLADVRRHADALGFEVVLAPEGGTVPDLVTLARGDGAEAVAARHRLDLSAPTDDTPFFFNMLRPQDWLLSGDVDPAKYPNMVAVSMLVNLLVIVAVLTALCVIVPLALTTRRPPLRQHGPLLVYFAAIGLGFMLIEVALLQRLTVFLGHPTYSLTTILFSLLIMGGLGSFLSGRLGNAGASRFVPLAGLLGAVTVVGLVTVPALRMFESSGASVRVAVAAALVAFAGFFMGMALPMGMRVAASSAPALIPWLWGINGATSVFGSVLAAAVALASGISVSYWAGVGCYALAVAALALKEGRNRLRGLEPLSNTANTGGACPLRQQAAAACSPVSP
jgi:hypothetical protein